MLFANLIGIVCAACMAVAPAVSEFENNAVCSAENTSFVASPKMAYYNPAETYGNSANYIFNYTSYNLYSNDNGSPESGPYGYGDDISFTSIQDTRGYRAYPDGVGMLEISGVDYDADLLLDYYVDGVFVSSVAPWEDWDESNIYILPYQEASLNGSYIWLFDHSEAAPYSPVDILGDIAEGLTGGIVPVAEGIGSGLQSLVSNIFLDGDGLSTFGIVAICFAGLALALCLSRWIVNFVSSLGARDR